MTFTTARSRRRVRALRWASLGVAAASAVGLLSLSPGTAPAAVAADASSAVTVSWKGGNPAELQRYQPDRSSLVDEDGNDAGSGHWDDFENLEVTVSQTQDLTDQAVSVSFSGMDQTVRAQPGYRANWNNFLQIMQCWGPDPLAADFAETCQYGSYGGQNGDDVKFSQRTEAGLGRGVSGRDQSISFDSPSPLPLPFRSVSGDKSVPYTIVNPGNSQVERVVDGLATFFSSETSNEVGFVSSRSDGAGRSLFEVQTAASAPHLGCGDPMSAAGNRCWLVVVPRGSHSGELGAGGTSCRFDPGPQYAFGEESTAGQFGSPLSSSCSYWNDRIVVPLGFRPTGSGCPAGTPERRTVGSQLIVEAVASWQPVLCDSAESTVYALTANSGTLARSQLLNGQADLAFTGLPATDEELTAAGADPTSLLYAPVANGALAVVFSASTPTAGLIDELRLSPRLLAKMLTQSYERTVPNLATGSVPPAHLAPTNLAYQTVVNDPEFQELNQFSVFATGTGQVVVQGPGGDDAIRQFWSYLQADDSARRWLAGEPDENGFTINPYYLPADHPRALGGGLAVDLAADSLDNFPRADQTEAPAEPRRTEEFTGKAIDSLMMGTQANNFEAVNGRVIRTDPQVLTSFDPNAQNGTGGWVSAGPQSQTEGQFLLGVTDAASAARSGLTTASLRLPNSDRFVLPTDDSIAAALPAATSDERGLGQPDIAQLEGEAYPVTSTTYAAIDVAEGRLDEAARAELAALLEYAAGDGQTPGDSPGQLPEGYAPLTAEQRALTATVARQIRAGVTRSDAAAGADAGAAAADSAGAGSGAPVDSSLGGGDTTTDVSAGTPVDTLATEPVSSPGQIALGGSLLAGIAGLVASPFLLRRRGAQS